ncbi:hypothetical protein M758_6G145300 [Ceratodon purpureus]|nr:hypothetical protein M758_6G145300 [Ceratodon purpureus]
MVLLLVCLLPEEFEVWKFGSLCCSNFDGLVSVGELISCQVCRAYFGGGVFELPW